MKGQSQINFEQSLKEEVGEFIVIIIKAGKGCCQHKGVLCKIEKDFLILIKDNVKVEIPLASVVAIKKRIKNQP